MQGENDNNFPELWGGIECTINRVGDRFFDQLEYAGHYNRVGDIDLLAATGVKKMRYPILWEHHQPERETDIDWHWTSQQLQQLQSRNIEVIAGLVHHGSGPAFTHLLDENFPALLAAYADKVARRFPHLTYFTPVNEPLTTARFSGLYGFWYPHKNDDASFLKMLLNELKGVVLSMQAIRKINPAAKLVQTEDLGKTYSTPLLQYQADFENERRWLTYELLCGKVTRDHPLRPFLLANGIRENELAFFEENSCTPDIFGFNHYLTSERFLDQRYQRYPRHTHGGNGVHRYADVEAVRVESKQEMGVEVLLKEAWQRYKAPMALTEVHLHCHREEQLRWFQHVWSASCRLKNDGIKLEAVTAWAMLGSYGWNRLLTVPQGDYEPGVFDLRGGYPRATALTGYLKKLTDASPFHPLSIDRGWWQRPTRFFQQPAPLPQCLPKLSECPPPLLIVGKQGGLARAFARVCEDRYIHYRMAGRDECDLADVASLRSLIATLQPWAVVYTDGLAQVEQCEMEPERCLFAHTTGPVNLATAAAEFGLPFASFSTDLVFDGAKRSPYTEDDLPMPLNAYGFAKALGEEKIMKAHPNALLVRTGPFFSPWDQNNFAQHVKNSLLNAEYIKAAADVRISPTYLPDLVHAVLDLLVDREKGTWHLANEGELSWVDFANEVADRFELDRQFIQAVPVAEIGYAAARPRYSVLTSSRGILLPSLDDALRRFTDELKPAVQDELRLRKSERA